MMVPIHALQWYRFADTVTYKPLAAEGCSMKYSDKFVDGSFSLHELFSLLDFFGCFFIFVGELF